MCGVWCMVGQGEVMAASNLKVAEHTTAAGGWLRINVTSSSQQYMANFALRHYDLTSNTPHPLDFANLASGTIESAGTIFPHCADYVASLQTSTPSRPNDTDAYARCRIQMITIGNH